MSAGPSPWGDHLGIELLPDGLTVLPIGSAHRDLKGEDRHAHMTVAIGDEALSLALVVDGHGGHEAAALCEGALLPMIVDHLVPGDLSPAALHRACTAAFASAHEQIHTLPGPPGRPPGALCTAPLCDRPFL